MANKRIKWLSADNRQKIFFPAEGRKYTDYESQYNKYRSLYFLLIIRGISDIFAIFIQKNVLYGVEIFKNL